VRTTSPVNYDAIAHLYDAQPYRRKIADPELLAFADKRVPSGGLSILDIACGTGSQLAANRSVMSDARFVGLDRSLGMLRQAQTKAPDIAWVQADAAMLPFPPQSFDFVTCQFGFHHLPDKARMLSAVFQVLRPAGRFVIRNLCPQEHPDWLYYDYFPEAQTLDLADFWPHEAIAATMTAIGFTAVTVALEHVRFEQDLRTWLDLVRRRDLNSQLMAISDAAYAAGVRRIEREAADETAPRQRADHLCLLTLRGDRPAKAPIGS
jgi:ubiquinone/menaquinone biosynthesis C-methylase UbiE